MPEGATKEQVPEMLQALLADRFKLAIHHDTKERSVYALVVGKGGSKLKEPPADPPAPAAAEKPDGAPGDAGTAPAADAAPQFNVKRNSDGSGTATVHGPDGNAKMSFGPNGMHMDLEKMTMEKLAEMLGRFVDRPVVDMTELKGSYQVGLDISMEDLKNVARKFGAAVPGVGPASGDAGSLPSDAASDPTGSVFIERDATRPQAGTAQGAAGPDRDRSHREDAHRELGGACFSLPTPACGRVFFKKISWPAKAPAPLRTIIALCLKLHFRVEAFCGG